MFYIILPIFLILHAPSPHSVPPLIKPNLLSNESYVENFNFTVLLNNNGLIKAQIMFSNIGPGDHFGICRLQIAKANQPVIQVEKKVKREHWSVDRDPVPRINVGPCKLTVSSTTTIWIPLDNVKLRLTLAASPKSTQPPGHDIQLNDSFYKNEILIPWATARIELNINQKKTIQSGFGYLDHSRSTNIPKDLARGWIRFRGFKPHAHVLITVRFPPDQNPASGWIWRSNDLGPQTIQHLQIYLPSNQTALPKLTINGKGIKIFIKTQRRYYRQTPVRDYGWLGRLAKPWLGDPITDVYLAVMTFQDKPDTPIRGILEIDHIQ